MNNTAYSFLSHSIRIGTNLLVFIFLARVLCIEDFGKFTFAITFATVFLYFAQFGLDRVSIIEISRNRSMINYIASNVMLVKLFLSLTTFSLAYLIMNMMEYQGSTKLLACLLMISVIIYSYTDFLNAIFRGIERLKYETIVALINNLALVLSIWISFTHGYGVIGIGFSYIFSRMIGFCFAYGVFRLKAGRIFLHFDYHFCMKTLKKALPFALISGVAAVLIDIDTIMLSYLKGDQSVGLYQAAMRIVESLTMLPLVLDGSFFPLLSKLHNQKSAFESVGKQLNVILLFLAIPLMAGLIVLADKIISFVFGDAFLESILVLQILSIVLLLRFFARGYEVVLMSAGKQKIIFCIILFATIFKMSLNIYAIPRFGINGAAVSAVLTHAVILISYLLVIKTTERSFMLERSISLILLFGILPVILIYYLKSLNLIALIMIYAICYLSSTLFILKKERSYLLQTMKSFGKYL